MTDNRSLVSWIFSADKHAVKRLLFVVVVLFALTWAVAIPVQFYLGVEWFPVVNAAGSVSLTAVLALLYFRQSKILESQQELLTAELNRDVRENHTETLRERVREWHGNAEIDISELDPFEGESDNLPSVGQTSFHTADNNGMYAFSEVEFTAIPSQLEEDYYFQDLLENHAQELRLKADGIEYLQSDFEQAKYGFINNFDYAKTKNNDQYTLEPTDDLAEWIFEELIKVQRYSDHTFEDTRDRMLAQIGSSREWDEGSTVWIHREVRSGSFAVYGAHFGSPQEFPARDEQEQLVEEVEQLIRSALAEIDEDRPFKQIDRAVDLLNRGEKAIVDLRYTLIEYDGRVVYPGDCKYLREESIVPRTGPNSETN